MTDEAQDTAQEERPTDMAPAGAELVVTDPQDEVEVFTVLDRHDEDLILQELEKQPGKALVYDFSQGGEKIVDLSYEGVNEAIRMMVSTGKVSIAIDPSSLQVESTQEDLGDGPEPCWQATVYARDAVTGYGQFGTFIQPKFKKVRDNTAARRKREGKTVTEDNKIPDPFSRQIALNKAQRNALRLFVPNRVRSALIATAKGDPNTYKTILAGRGAEAVADLPPPLTDERALGQKEEARKLYDELRGLDPTKVPPALFHTYLTRAEHDHERLDDFLTFLRKNIEESQSTEKS